MEYEVFSSRGKVRPNNEDGFLVKINPFPLLAVADGMGGHRAGEVASKIAIEFLKEYEFKPKDYVNQIDKVIKEINKKIFNRSQKDYSCRGMGTTLSFGIIINLDLYVGHIGDSRIYLFRDGKLDQITTDHSLVNELLERNQITKDEAFSHPQRHILTQALGLEPEFEMEIKKISLKKGDFLLFCTDGLSDMVRFEEIEKSFIENDKLITIRNSLVNKAMESGGHDNITLVIGQII